MIKTHTLTITETPASDGGEPERDYELACGDTDIYCQSYRPCRMPECTNLTDAEWRDIADEHGFAYRHGDAHVELEDFGWSAGTGDCYLPEAFNFGDAAEHFATTHGLTAGEHPVSVSISDDGIEIEPAAEATR